MLRSGLRQDNRSGRCSREETPAIEEQNGVVGDLAKVDSQQKNAQSNLCLSLQMSMHMQHLSSSFRRVSGFEKSESDDASSHRCSIHDSLDVVPSDHFPSFTDFSESCEEEADENPWRESTFDEETCKREVGSCVAESSVDHGMVQRCPSERKEEPLIKSPNKGGLQLSMKWLQSDMLFRRVLLLYDDIRDRRTYNITNGEEEHVVRNGAVV